MAHGAVSEPGRVVHQVELVDHLGQDDEGGPQQRHVREDEPEPRHGQEYRHQDHVHRTHC